jgi:hypothetical protein
MTLRTRLACASLSASDASSMLSASHRSSSALALRVWKVYGVVSFLAKVLATTRELILTGLGPAEEYRGKRTSGGPVRRSCPTPSLPPPASPRRGAPPRSGTSRLGRGSVRWYGSVGWRSRRDTRALGAAVRAGESRRRGRYTGRGSRIGRWDGSTRARVRRIAPPRDGRAPERASRASVSTWPSSTPVAGACVRRP